MKNNICLNVFPELEAGKSYAPAANISSREVIAKLNNTGEQLEMQSIEDDDFKNSFTTAERI